MLQEVSWTSTYSTILENGKDLRPLAGNTSNKTNIPKAKKYKMENKKKQDGWYIYCQKQR